jgi:hypothetical protein
MAVLQIATGGKLENRDWMRLGMAYNVKEKIPAASAKMLMRSPLFREAIKLKIAEILRSKHLTVGSVLDYYTDAIEIARQKKDAMRMIEGADRLMKLMHDADSSQAGAEKIDWDAEIDAGPEIPELDRNFRRPKRLKPVARGEEGKMTSQERKEAGNG